MNGIETFLNAYGLPAIAAVLLIKSIGVPIPIPADVLMFAAVARVARGTDGLGLTFAILLIAIIIGDVIQFWLARGPGRTTVYRVGRYLGLTPARLDAASTLVRKSGPVGLAVIMLTPGVRAASVVACGLANVSLRVFVLGLVIGEGLFLALHFFLGSILGVIWQQAHAKRVGAAGGRSLHWVAAGRFWRMDFDPASSAANGRAQRNRRLCL